MHKTIRVTLMVGHMIHSNMLITKELTLIEISTHDIFNLTPINMAKISTVGKKILSNLQRSAQKSLILKFHYLDATCNMRFLEY